MINTYRSYIFYTMRGSETLVQLRPMYHKPHRTGLFQCVDNGEGDETSVDVCGHTCTR